MIENLGNHPTILIVFSVLILGMLVLDLGVFNKNAHRVSSKEAATWTLVWISLSMLFSVFILKQTSVEKFSQFQSAYWIEKALSVDNLFVFILVFNFFKVPEESHHKVLFWGIMETALVFSVAPAHMICQMSAIYGIDIEGKFSRLVALRAAVATCRPFVRFQCVPVFIHFNQFGKLVFEVV